MPDDAKRAMTESMAREIYEFEGHNDVGHTLIGSWIPGRYVQVFTHWDDGTKPLLPSAKAIPYGFTTVSRCDEFGSIKLDAADLFHTRYDTLEKAREGHQKVVERYSHWYRV